MNGVFSIAPQARKTTRKGVPLLMVIIDPESGEIGMESRKRTCWENQSAKKKGATGSGEKRVGSYVWGIYPTENGTFRKLSSSVGKRLRSSSPNI